MIPVSDGVRRIYRALFIVICLVLVIGLSGFLTYRKITTTGMLKHWRVKLELYLDGTVHKPWAYRVLVPLSIRFLSQAVPEKQVQNTFRFGEEMIQALRNSSPGYKRPSENPAQGKETSARLPSYYFHLAGVTFLSILVYPAIVGVLYRKLFVSPWWYCALVPVISLVVLIPFVRGGFGHIYDFPLLMFMTALLHAMATHRHKLFLVLFAASCLNKETTVLMTVAYASYFYDRLPRPKFLLYVGIQCLTFAVVYGYLRYHFAANPGMSMEIVWLDQVRWFMSRSFTDFATFLIIVGLIAYRWDEKPLVLRRAAAMLVPLIALFLVAVNPGEMRNFYESLPLLSLLFCRNLELLGRSLLGSHTGGVPGHEERQAVLPS